MARSHIVKLLIQAGSPIQAGPPIQAGSRLDVPYVLYISGLDTSSLNKNVFRVSNHVHLTYTKNVMWQDGDVLIEAESLIQAGCSRAFVLIEAAGLY